MDENKIDGIRDLLYEAQDKLDEVVGILSDMLNDTDEV